jgi:hypothetical protein
MLKKFIYFLAFLSFFFFSHEKGYAEEYKIKDYNVINIEKVQAVNQLSYPISYTSSSQAFPGWVYDSGRRYIYFAPFDSNDLLFLNPSTLKVEHKLSFPEPIKDLEFKNDQIYVASSGQIYVVHPTDKRIIDTYFFNNKISQFALYKDKIFTTSSQYNMTEKTEQPLPYTGLNWNRLAAHPTKDMIYIAGQNVIASVDPNTFQVIDKSTMANNSLGKLFFYGDHVFYRDLDVNATALSQINGTYRYREVVKHVTDQYVFTENSVYWRKIYMPKQQLIRMEQGISDAEYLTIDDHVYIYLPRAQTVIRTKLLSTVNDSIFKMKTPPSVVEFSTPITSYYHDKARNRIYLVFKDSNQLVEINALDMSIVQQMSIGSKPVKITRYNDSLYIGFEGRSSLLELSLDLQSQRYIEMKKQLKNFVMLNDKVYFYEVWNNPRIFIFDLKTSELTTSSSWFTDSPPLDVINGEVTFAYFNRGSFGLQPLDAAANYRTPFYSHVYLEGLPKLTRYFRDNDFIYFGHYKAQMTGEELKLVQKLVDSTRGDYILNVVDDRVVTNLAVYNGSTKATIHDLPEEAGEFLIDNDKNGYLISKDRQDIVKLAYPYKETTRMRTIPFYTEIRNAYLPSRLTDITYSFAKSQIEYLVGVGVINGYADGTFRPKQTISNIEAAAMLSRAIDLYGKNTVMPKLVDIPSSNKFYPLVMDNLDPNWTEPVFKNPAAKTTRKEMALALQRAFGLKGSNNRNYKDVSLAKYPTYVPAIESLAYHGITNGYLDGTFKPDALITRDEFAAFLARTVLEQYNLDK